MPRCALLSPDKRSPTSTGVASTRTCWMADRNTLGLGLARPTQQMACSSPEYSTGTSPLQAGHSTQHAAHGVMSRAAHTDCALSTHSHWRVCCRAKLYCNGMPARTASDAQHSTTQHNTTRHTPAVVSPQEQAVVHGGPRAPDLWKHPAEAHRLAGAVLVLNHSWQLRGGWGHSTQQRWPLQRRAATSHRRQ